VVTRRIQIALVLMVMGITAACASRPVKYYVLDTGPAPMNASQPRYPVTLLVSRINTLHLYRDDRLVYGSGEYQLGTYEYQRWAESPADMMQEKLIAYLRSSGAYRSVLAVSTGVRGDYIVHAHLSALDEVETPSFAARFSFQLELFDPKTASVVWSDSYTHDEPVNGSAKKKSVSDVVEALDKNVNDGLTQLTAKMADYIGNHLPPQSAPAR
jgi:ABC-type uncharacterized transport system auxiliary subunit